MYLNVFPTALATGDSGGRSQERRMLSHVENLLSWVCLGKRKKPVKMINFLLLPFLDRESSFQDPRRISPCLLTKTLARP
jgi:hypothetical protein